MLYAPFATAEMNLFTCNATTPGATAFPMSLFTNDDAQISGGEPHSREQFDLALQEISNQK
jgi:hypothetical protein